MSEPRARILIVDDKSGVRTTVSDVLCEIGFHVRTAKDGYSALREIRRETPDILLSDLHMPGMSGFELLAVVRRRFPSIQTVAMSGAFQGDEVPSGVAADAFYQKGSSVGSLLRIIDALPRPERMHSSHAIALAPVWIERNEGDNSGEAYATISCPECLRTFSEACGGSNSLERETDCIYCHSLIHYAIVQSTDQAPAQANPEPSREAQPGSLPQNYC